MCALWERATIGPAPSMLRTLVAAALSDRRIIGPSMSRSHSWRSRPRTPGRLRYAASSIALNRLAIGAVRAPLNAWILPRRSAIAKRTSPVRLCA